MNAEHALSGLGVASVAGIILAMSLPPIGWWPAAPMAIALVIELCRGQSCGRRALVGLGLGCGHFAVTLSWAADFSMVGYLALIALESAFFAVAMVLAGEGRFVAVTVPAAWVLAEALRVRWPFGGLPLGGVALGQAAGPLAPVASVAGDLGVIAVTVAVAVVVAALRRRHVQEAGAVLAAIVLVAAVGRLPFTKGEEHIRVATVQGGGPRGVARVDSDPARVFQRHLDSSQSAPEGTDLVLWPEDVVDTTGLFSGSAQHRALSALARAQGATLVAGIVEGVGPRRFRNAAVSLGPDGTVTDRYDKVHRVPFGEYVPGRKFLQGAVDLSAVPRDAIPGSGPGVLNTPLGRLGVVISFEVFFAGRARSAVSAGGRLLLVPTNASSYRGQMVPAQELAAAQLRAWETGRSVVQAAPTGYSAFVSARGKVLGRTELGRSAVSHRDVQLRSGLTPYARVGDTPLLMISGVAVFAPRLLALNRRRRP